MLVEDAAEEARPVRISQNPMTAMSATPDRIHAGLAHVVPADPEERYAGQAPLGPSPAPPHAYRRKSRRR